MHARRSWTLITVVGALVGCGSSTPADVAGNYTIAITSGANGCMFDNWTEGDTASGIPVVVTQDGDQASAEVQGLAALRLDAALGEHVFTGAIDGDDVALTIIGTRSATEGNCTYTYNAALDATSDGAVLTGTITDRAATSVQAFNGTRPPT